MASWCAWRSAMEPSSIRLRRRWLHRRRIQGDSVITWRRTGGARAWNPMSTGSASNGCDRTMGTRQDIKAVLASGLFDLQWYRQWHPGVPAAPSAAAGHFLEHVLDPGHDPGPGFSVRRYLDANPDVAARSEEHPSELPSLMRTSYAVFCL